MIFINLKIDNKRENLKILEFTPSLPRIN